MGCGEHISLTWKVWSSQVTRYMPLAFAHIFPPSPSLMETLPALLVFRLDLLSVPWFFQIGMSLTDRLRKVEAFSFCLLHIPVLRGTRALEMFLFIYFAFWSHQVFVAVRGLSPVVEAGSCSAAAIAGLLLLVAFLPVEHGTHGLQQLRFPGSSAWAQQFRCTGTGAQFLLHVWALPRPGLEPGSLALAGRLLSTEPPGKSSTCF